MSIKNIHRNSYSDTPITIKRKVDNNLRDVKKAYTKINGNLVLVWDVTENNEYLKVSESYIGQKFLERYYSQSIYTSIYWVHEVDGIITETYLSTNELNSWECTTLEPYYYTDGDKQYVGYYQTPTDSGFGQYDMKITYKSPDTGNILEIEYPIYYLEEKFYTYGDSVTWYPFRNYLDRENFGYATLHYECRDKNNNLIEQNNSYAKNTTYVNYEFPKPTNADFYFGDSQEVKYTFISPNTYRQYTGNSIWNIRPYTDMRNTQSVYSKNMKDLQPLKFIVDINDSNTYYQQKEDTTSIVVYPITSPMYYKSGYTPTYFPTEDTELYMSTYNTETTERTPYQKCTYQEALVFKYDKIAIGRKFTAPFIADDFCIHGVNVGCSVYHYPASTGYIYWGDDTFSYYASGRNYYSTSSTPTDYTKFYFQNGYTQTNANKRAIAYIYPFKEVQEHTYSDNGIYDVVITSANATNNSNSIYDSTTKTYAYDVTSVINFNVQSTLPNGNTAYTNWSTDSADVNPFNGDYIRACDLTHKDFKAPVRPIQTQLKGLELGNGFFTGYYRSLSYRNGTTYRYNRSGYYGNYNQTDNAVFTGGTNIQSAGGYWVNTSSLDSLLNLEYIKMPKINSNFGFSPFLNWAKSLKDIYYDGSKADWDKFFTRENGVSYLNEFLDGTDITTSSTEYKHLNCFRYLGDNYFYRGLLRRQSSTSYKYFKYAFNETYTLNIHCTDVTFSIVLAPTDKWTTIDFSTWQIQTFNEDTQQFEYKNQGE